MYIHSLCVVIIGDRQAADTVMGEAAPAAGEILANADRSAMGDLTESVKADAGSFQASEGSGSADTGAPAGQASREFKQAGVKAPVDKARASEVSAAVAMDTEADQPACQADAAQNGTKGGDADSFAEDTNAVSRQAKPDLNGQAPISQGADADAGAQQTDGVAPGSGIKVEQADTNPVV